ncbi:MAG: caspase family protein [Sediminibacterium sp.]|nr:caspase family protein [Sediminibacterium sp.]
MKKALIVGIDQYPNAPLYCCVKDANAVSTILETHGDGSPNFEIKSKTNVKEKGILKRHIQDLFSGDGIIALLYFSGHGYLNELGGYIVTPDAKAFDEGIAMNDILAMANESKFKNRVIILDCCHAGALGQPNLQAGISTQIAEGVTILTACRKDEPAIETNGHGIFTNLLLDALQGGAADIRGNITPGSVYAYIDQALGAWEQRPVFKTNITQFVALREITPLVPKETLRRLTEFFPSASDEFSLDPSYEWSNKPIAIEENVKTFKQLQSMNRVGLIVPVDTSDMYYAAMESKSCKLTALGYHYWRLAKSKKI